MARARARARDRASVARAWLAATRVVLTNLVRM